MNQTQPVNHYPLTLNMIEQAPRLLDALEQARAALPDAWLAVKCDVPKELIDLINDVIEAAKRPDAGRGPGDRPGLGFLVLGGNWYSVIGGAPVSGPMTSTGDLDLSEWAVVEDDPDLPERVRQFFALARLLTN